MNIPKTTEVTTREPAPLELTQQILDDFEAWCQQNLVSLRGFKGTIDEKFYIHRDRLKEELAQAGWESDWKLGRRGVWNAGGTLLDVNKEYRLKIVPK